MHLKAMIKNTIQTVGRLSYKSIRHDHVVLAILAVIIGLMAAYGAIGFRQIISNLQLFTYQTNSFLSASEVLSWWQILLIPILGGLFVGLLVKSFTHLQRPSSVADVIEGNALHDGKVNVKEGLVSALATSVSLGVGASAGREGPVVHLGATLSSILSQKLNLGPNVARTLLACGVASAVASSFNAPIAGVFFALEVVMGHYAIHAFAPVVIAGIAGTMITRIHLGDFPAFIIPDLVIYSPLEFPAFLLLGIASGLCGMFFMKSLIFSEDTVNKIPLPSWLLPAIGGLLVGLIGLFVPEILGVGYEATDNALKENYGLVFLLTLLIAKIVATAITLGFRFGGGVFSPSLYLGAMLGGAFGYLANWGFGGESSDLAVYTIVGMGAVASSVLGAPISTILIVFELTADYSITIAVMIACAVASLITSLMNTKSYFYLLLNKRGVHLEAGKANHLIKTSTVESIINRNFYPILKTAKITDVKDNFLEHAVGKLIVVDENNCLYGLIMSSEITNDKLKMSDEKKVTAKDICHKNLIFVTKDDSLESTLGVMEGSGKYFLPVVDNNETKKVLGFVRYRYIISLYNQALATEHAEMRGLKK